MTKQQRDFVKQVVESHKTSTFASSSSLQMGGGCIIEMKQPNNSSNDAPVLYLRAHNVLNCLCKLVFSSTTHLDSWKRHSVCSIVLQRVSSSIHIPRKTMQSVGEYIEKMQAGSDDQINIEA